MWVKAIEVDGIIRGHCKPVNSSSYLTRMHETILHLIKRGDVLVDKLAVGAPYADKSNIRRQDRRNRGNVWLVPYDTVQSKTEKFDHPDGFSARAAGPLHQAAWAAS